MIGALLLSMCLVTGMVGDMSWAGIGSSRASMHRGAGWTLHKDAWSRGVCEGQNSTNSISKSICPGVQLFQAKERKYGIIFKQSVLLTGYSPLEPQDFDAIV